MVINFSDLLSKKNRKKEISLSFELEPFEFEGEEIRCYINRGFCKNKAKVKLFEMLRYLYLSNRY